MVQYWIQLGLQNKRKFRKKTVGTRHCHDRNTSRRAITLPSCLFPIKKSQKTWRRRWSCNRTFKIETSLFKFSRDFFTLTWIWCFYVISAFWIFGNSFLSTEDGISRACQRVFSKTFLEKPVLVLGIKVLKIFRNNLVKNEICKEYEKKLPWFSKIKMSR